MTSISRSTRLRRLAPMKASLAVAGSAMAINAFGLLAGPAPAQADSCFQWAFNGSTGFHESSGWEMWFKSTGTTAQGRVEGIDLGTGGYPTSHGTIEHGSVVGHGLDITVRWDSGTVQRFTGTVIDGKATGSTNNPDYQTWYEVLGNPLKCIDQELPPAPPPAPADSKVVLAPGASDAPPPVITTPIGRTSVQIKSGPATLQAGLSGTYVVTVTNTFTDSKPVQVNIIFSGKLEQTGQINAQGGLDCVVAHDAGINAAVNCTGPIPQGSFDIVVQGRGSTPGAGLLLAKLDNDSKQQNVTIT